MLSRLAHLSARRPRLILALTAAWLIVAISLGASAPKHLKGGRDFEDPSSPAATVREQVEAATGVGTAPGVVVRVSGAGAQDRAERVASIVAGEPLVAATTILGAADRYVAVTFRAASQAALEDATERLEERLDGVAGVEVGGRLAVGRAVSEQVGRDLARAEMLAFPFILLLSFVFFRGLVAALLPSFVGVLTIFGSFLGLRLLDTVQPLSVFAVNLVIALGLGLAIDYSLFVVSRYREEAARDGFGAAALERTLRTAGRTVLFSAVTVAAAMASLLVFPLRFLYSMGLGGMLAALIAAAVSLTALPALLIALGPRIDALAPDRLRRGGRRVVQPGLEGGWASLARAVMRRPAVIATVSALALLVLGSQFLRVEFTGISASVLPAGAPARHVDESIRADVPEGPASPVVVVAEAPASAGAGVAQLRDRLGALPGAAVAGRARYVGAGLWQIDVVPAGGPLEEQTLHLVRAIREVDAGVPVGVTGQTAEFLDQQASVSAGLPVALAILCATTFALLLLMTGSLVLAVKALVMNVLTMSAALGLLVLIFQDGRLEGLLGYTSQGALESTQPVLLCAVAFGLSTDYAVFLLGRIKEAHDRGRPDRDAVAFGLERTGRIVTAAALLFTVAIGAFATSDIIFIKQVGVGTALAVLIDATVVRALLVPSLMALLGRRNWWAPARLRALHARVRA